MNSRLDELASRKELLLARSRLCRLKIRHDVAVLRNDLSWPHAAAAVVQAPAVRSAAFLLAVEFVGPERTARLLALAARAIAIARLARVVRDYLRRTPAEPAPPQ